MTTRSSQLTIKAKRQLSKILKYTYIFISVDVSIFEGTTEDEYLEKLKEVFSKSLKEF